MARRHPWTTRPRRGALTKGRTGDEAAEPKATPRPRVRKAVRNRVRALNAAAFVVGLWGLLHPRPVVPVVVVLVLFPWLAVGALFRWPDSVGVLGGRIDPRPDVFGPLLLPALGLALYGARVNLLANGWAIVGGCALALPLAAATAVARGRASAPVKLGWLLLAPAFFGYGYGAAVAANVLPDGSPAEVRRARVIWKQEVHGRFGSVATSWSLGLEPWEGGAAMKAEVSRRTHDAAFPGGTVRLLVHPGALGIPWYVVAADRHEPDS